MKILDYERTENRPYWLERIAESDWRAGQYLAELLRCDRFHGRTGEKSRVLLLTEGEQLIAFCTYAQRDEIEDEALTPWAGFVYTFPEYRGKRRMGKLLEHVYGLAKENGFPFLYISTDQEGIYEKYGFRFLETRKNTRGDESRIYCMEIRRPDYRDVIGRRVHVTIDRPMGSVHPQYPDLVYPVNYGYIRGEMAGDGEEQDVYVLGVREPLDTFTGTVTAVLHRLNDVEDKWVAVPEGMRLSREEILQAVFFQEQYYMGELCL